MHVLGRKTFALLLLLRSSGVKQTNEHFLRCIFNIYVRKELVTFLIDTDLQFLIHSLIVSYIVLEIVKLTTRFNSSEHC